MRIAERFRQLPAVGQVLVIWAASRVLSTALLLSVFVVASVNGLPFASFRKNPTFFTFSGLWDASAYKNIATHGYPLDLPLDSAGHVVSNEWAFMPAFPWLTRGVMEVTGAEFYPAGVVVATIFGALAALALYRVLAGRVGNRSALWAVVLFCFGPMAFMLQTAYAESMFLFLLFCSLAAMIERRYLLMLPFALVAAFTRPGILSIALALGIVFLVRVFRKEDFPLAEKARVVVSGLLIAAAGLAWPVIAERVTGHPGAYIETELSWWVGFIGRQHFVPLSPWFIMAFTYLGLLGIALVLALVAVFAWWLTRRRMRELGLETVLFGASYGLYLLAVFLPQESTFRLLMPLAPILGDPAIARRRKLRTFLLAGGITLQAAAVVLLWFLAYP